MLEPVTLRFMDAHPADAARVLEALDVAALAALVRGLPADTAAGVLRHMTPDALAGCLRALGEEAAAVVGHLPVAIAAPALRALEPAVRRGVIAALPKTVSVPLGLALRYPLGTAGALLDPLAACVHEQMTMAETVQIARRAPELVRRYVYVLDERQKLVGVLDVRECLIASRAASVHSVMRPHPVAVRARARLAEVAALPAWSQLDVLPVVDRADTFLGVLRRRALEMALRAPDADDEREQGVTGAVIDLADLYWQATTAMFLGDRREREGGRER